MLKRIFGARAKPVRVQINDVFRVFELHNDRFKPAPEQHIGILARLGEYTLRGTAPYGPARAFFKDPGQTITIKDRPSAFSDIPVEERQIPGSAYIAFTEEPAAFGRRAFGLVIHRDAATESDASNSLIFGLYGIYDSHGRMTIKKILMPEKDTSNRTGPTQSVPVTDENVRKGLRFAELCARNLYREERFYPYICLDEAGAAPGEATAIRIIPPGPA